MTEKTQKDSENVPAAEQQWQAAESGDRSRANRKTLIILFVVGIGMFGFAFANAPLFNLLCRVVGIQQSPNEESVATDGEKREVEVRFIGLAYDDLPISLTPINRIQKTRLGTQTLNDYRFVNMTDRPLYFRPVHSVTPTRRAADHFKLSECFCFDDQKLQPNQTVTLPVVYTIGTDLDSDIDAITLNYTLFEITEKDYIQTTTAKKAEEAAKAAEAAP